MNEYSKKFDNELLFDWKKKNAEKIKTLHTSLIHITYRIRYVWFRFQHLFWNENLSTWRSNVSYFWYVVLGFMYTIQHVLCLYMYRIYVWRFTSRVSVIFILISYWYKLKINMIKIIKLMEMIATMIFTI